MSTRVVATERARAAAHELHQMVTGSLKNEIQRLRAAGQVLCNPNEWDGPLAQQFRTHDWPPMSRTMTIEMEELGKLSTSVEKIVRDILAAGNEGSVEQSSSPKGNGFVDYARKVNSALAFGLKPVTVSNAGALAYNGYKYFKTVREFPALARGLFSSTVSETALAFDRGTATLRELEQATGLAMTRIGIAKAFTVTADFRNLKDGSFGTIARMLRTAAADAGEGGQWMSGASRVFQAGRWVYTPLVIVSDVYTIINPGNDIQGAERGAVQGLAFLNLAGQLAVGADLAGLLAANAALDWIPVAGQILAVTTGLILAADWAYHTFPGFHHFVDNLTGDTVSVAKNTWRGISSGATATGSFFAHLF